MSRLVRKGHMDDPTLVPPMPTGMPSGMPMPMGSPTKMTPMMALPKAARPLKATSKGMGALVRAKKRSKGVS